MAGDPSAIGRSAIVNGAPAIIVGIATAFRGLMAERPADVFAPLDVDRDGGAGGREHDGPPGDAAASRHVARRSAEQKMAAIYKSLGPSMAREGELQLTLGDASRGRVGCPRRTALADCARAWCSSAC